MFLDILKKLAEDWKNLFRVQIEPPIGVWIEPERFKRTKDDEIIVLSAEELKQLRWMTVSQLKAAFKGREHQFRAESSAAAYQELRWMTTAQIEAIFGTKDI